MMQAIKSMQLIFGLGKTGLSCAQYFNDRNMPFRAMDSRDTAPFATEIAQLYQCQLTLCGDPDLHLDAMQQHLDGVTQIIVSPGVAIKGAFFDFVKQQNIDIIGDIELFAREAKAPIVAITGSNGKSTVTQLTTELLQAAGYDVLMGGNIGTPALDLFKQAQPDFYVLELSSFQLETTKSLHPKAGTVLNISVDHMDRYQSFEDYAAVKLAMLDTCETRIINRDEFDLKTIDTANDKSTEITISLGLSAEHSDYYRQRQEDGSFWIANADGPLLDQSELKIAGLHNVSNAMAALALCEACGVSLDQAMLTQLSQWSGLQHRCQFVAEKQGIRCYNDSKATNVGATIAALEGLSQTIDGRLILIAGGDGKGADFTPLDKVLKRYLKALVLIGKDAERFLDEAGKGIGSVIVNDMKQAVAAAFSFAERGDAILLSPACASFDMYKNFEHRGDVFCDEVRAWC